MASTTISPMRMIDDEAALRLVRKVISSYPSANPMQLVEYSGELTLLLSKLSEGVATAAIDKAMLASPNFPPPVPLVKNHADELAKASSEAFDYARQWEAQSQKQLRERAEQEAAEESPEHRAKVIERIRREMAAAGMPFEQDRKQFHGETPETVRKKLGVSEAEWDALPDAPPAGRWERLVAGMK